MYKRQVEKFAERLAVELKFFVCCRIYTSCKLLLISKSACQFIRCLRGGRNLRGTLFAKNGQNQEFYCKEQMDITIYEIVNALGDGAPSKTMVCKRTVDFNRGRT